MIPHHILTLSYNYYHFETELQKFSKIYKSGDGWRFYDGNTCIKRKKVATMLSDDHDDIDTDREEDTYQNYKWILLDISPIINDIHCWRIYIRNPNKGLIVIGVCKQRMFKTDKGHSTLVYGIGSAENQWYPDTNNNIKHNDIDLTQFNQKECQIDMKLNSITGQLSFCMVDNCDNRKINSKQKQNHQEAIIKGLPLDNYAGWVPYYNSYDNSVGCQLKTALCPISWYGRYKDAIFE